METRLEGGILEERKVAVIPKVMVSGALGPKEYGVLLTDQRSIFVLESSSKAAIGAALGGAIGAAIADALTDEKKSVDYINCDPSTLAADGKNICVPHSSIQSLALKKSMGGYKLKLAYTDGQGKTRKVGAVLTIPPELAGRRKAEGVKLKVAMEEYAVKARQALELALPPEVVSRAEMRI